MVRKRIILPYVWWHISSWNVNALISIAHGVSSSAVSSSGALVWLCQHWSGSERLRNFCPEKGAEWLRAGFEARLADLYQQWQALRISTARFAELLGVSPWELDDLLQARGLKVTNLPG
jgi:hypothetical protein